MLEVAGFQIIDAGASAILAGVVIAIFVDKLVPAPRRDREVSFWRDFADRVTQERDEWKQAAQANGQRADVLLDSVRKLAEKELSSARAVETLQDLAEQRRVP